MKNFWTLFCYEMKKIWKRPLLWAALLGSIIVSAAGVLPFEAWDESGGNYHFTYRDGRETSGYVTQAEKWRIAREWAPKLNGKAMDEEFFRQLRESLQNVMLEENIALRDGDVEGYFLLAEHTFYWYYLHMNLVPDLRNINEEKYYEQARIKALSNLYNGGIEELSQEEIAYWTELSERVRTPYVYEYFEGWSQIDTTLVRYSGHLIPVLIGVALCEVFSGEHRRQTAALVFASRRGRRVLYLAKTLAACSTALLTVLPMFASAVAAAHLIYGGGWFWTPLQMGTYTCWPITMGQALLIRLVLCLAYALLCGGVVLLASLLTRSAVVGLSAALGVMISQFVLPSFFIGASWLPGNLLSGSTFRRYQLVTLLGCRFNWVQMGPALYAGVGLILTAFCALGWRRWAVAGK